MRERHEPVDERGASDSMPSTGMPSLILASIWLRLGIVLHLAALMVASLSSSLRLGGSSTNGIGLVQGALVCDGELADLLDLIAEEPTRHGCSATGANTSRMPPRTGERRAG
jgi:hypothetical protein